MRKLLALLTVLCFTTVASATITATLEPVAYVAPDTDLAYDIGQYEAECHKVWDLVVHVSDGDKWNTAGIECMLTGTCDAAVFWDHPMGGDTQPDTGDFAYFGLVAYDTFWTCTEEYPNPDIDPLKNATTFAPGNPIANEPQYKYCEWYHDPEDPEVGDGDFTIMRMNVLCDPDCCDPGDPFYADLEVWGVVYGDSGVYDVDLVERVCVPEPASLALLALGGLLIRRR